MGQLKSKKVGRNNPCPCGSGKKYKKCCDGVTEQQINLWWEEWMQREIDRWDKYSEENGGLEPGKAIKEYKKYFEDKEKTTNGQRFKALTSVLPFWA